MLLRHEHGYDKVSDQIYLGRYPLTVREFPRDASIIVDMTAEFFSRWSLIRGGKRLYFCEPCLDQMMPSPTAIIQLSKSVVKVLDEDRARKAYVHCANGRGRSSSLVVLIFLIRGQVNSIEEGFEKLRDARPQVKTSSVQRSAIRLAFEQFLHPDLMGKREKQGDVELSCRMTTPDPNGGDNMLALQ